MEFDLVSREGSDVKNMPLALRASTLPKLVCDRGHIPFPDSSSPNAAPSSTLTIVILSVCVDPGFFQAEDVAWQSSGYRITPTGSIREAIDRIRYGDFELVLLGDSIAVLDRERLTFLIRSAGHSVPVLSISAAAADAPAGAIAGSEPNGILKKIGELFAVQKFSIRTSIPSPRSLIA